MEAVQLCSTQTFSGGLRHGVSFVDCSANSSGTPIHYGSILVCGSN